jgi:hypothetical protein
VSFYCHLKLGRPYCWPPTPQTNEILSVIQKGKL